MLAFLSLLAFTAYSDDTLIINSGTEITSGQYDEYKDTTKFLIIQSPVQTIERDAFRSWSKLESVEIGNTVTSIGFQAFEYCYDLTNVILGENVQTFNNYCFSSTNIKNLTIYTNKVLINTITNYVGSDLETCTLGSLISVIDDQAFLIAII